MNNAPRPASILVSKESLMKKFHTVLALAFLSTSLMGGVALAQDNHAQDNHDQDNHAQDNHAQDNHAQDNHAQDNHDQDHRDNHTYVEHSGWHKGARLKHEDWDRGDKVDYRQYHLNAPPRGYEWRTIDGYYVLANPSTFQIRATVRIP